MSISINPSNRIHTNSDVLVNETVLEEGDKLIIVNEETLVRVNEYLEEVSRDVLEFKNKLQNTIDVNQLDKIKGQLGDLNLLPATETIMSSLTKIRDGFYLKADALDVERIKTILVSKADANELMEIANIIGKESLSLELNQNIISAINQLLSKINALDNIIQSYVSKNGDDLTGLLSYNNSVRDFSGLEIPHASWVNKQVTNKLGTLDNTGFTSTTNVASCLAEIKTSLDNLKSMDENFSNIIGNLSTTSIPEGHNITVSSSLSYLNELIKQNTINIEANSETIQQLLSDKADKISLEEVKNDLSLLSGSHVIINVLNEENQILAAMTEEQRQLFLTEKAKEAGRKTLKDGYEIRTRDGFKYYYFKGTWYFVDNADVAYATINSAGLIRFRDQLGFVSPSGRGDGTAVVKGFEELYTQVQNIQSTVENTVDSFLFEEIKRDYDKHFETVDNDLQILKDNVSSNIEKLNETSILSNKNRQDIGDLITSVNNLDTITTNLRTDVNANTKGINISKQASIDAANSADIARIKAEESATKATEAKNIATEVENLSRELLVKIGDVDSITIPNCNNVSSSINYLNDKVTEIFSTPFEISNNNTVKQVFKNGDILRTSTLGITDPIYTRPVMFTDKRGYIHFLAEYKESRSENVKTEIVYSVAKNGFRTVEKEHLLNVMPDEDIKYIKPTIIYDDVNDKAYILIGKYNVNDDLLNLTAWTHSIFMVGTWDNLQDKFLWEKKTIGRNGCNVVVNNIPNELTSFLGGGSNGLRHPEANILMIPIQWSNGSIIKNAFLTFDGVSWTFKDYADTLDNRYDPCIYRSVNGSTDHIFMVSRSTLSNGVSVSFTPNKGNYIEKHLGLSGGLIGKNYCSQLSATTVNSRNGRQYGVISTTNYIKDAYRDKVQNKITIFLASDKSNLFIPVEILSITGDKLDADTNTPYDFLSCIDFSKTSDGDKLYVHYETREGTFLKDISSLLPRLDLLHDKYDYSNAGLTSEQIKEVTDMINDSSIVGSGPNADSVSRRLNQLELFDKDINERLNEVRKMLEGAIRGMRFVGIAPSTKEEVVANPNLLTEYVNSRFTDPLERLRGGDVVSTKDKYTFVYLRNEEGIYNWEDYNNGGDLGDILNRLDALESIQPELTRIFKEIKVFLTDQVEVNNNNSNNVNELFTQLETIINNIGDLTDTNIESSDGSIGKMLKELSTRIDLNVDAIHEVNFRIGNLRTTGLTNTNTVADCIKELNDNDNRQKEVFEEKLQELRDVDASIKEKVNTLLKYTNITTKGFRFVGIIKRTRAEVEENKQLLTDYVNLRFADVDERLQPGDIVSTTDKYTFVYLVNEHNGVADWELYNPDENRDRVDALEQIVETIKVVNEQLRQDITNVDLKISNLIAPDGMLATVIAELKAKYREIDDKIGTCRDTGFEGNNLTENIRNIKLAIEEVDVRDKIGDIGSSTIESIINDINTDISRLDNSNSVINSTLNNKADLSVIENIRERLERVEGAHIVVDILRDTKEEIEAQYDRDGYLNQKVIDAGRETVENGYELRTSDGYGYYNYKGRWYLTDKQIIGNATTTSSGLVKFKDEKGYLISSPLNDGTAIIKGYSELETDVYNTKNALDNKVDKVTYDRDKGVIENKLEDLNNKSSEALQIANNANSTANNNSQTINTINQEFTTIKENFNTINNTIGDIGSSGCINTSTVADSIKELNDKITEISLYNSNEDIINVDSFKLSNSANDYGALNNKRDIFSSKYNADIGDYNTNTTRIYRTATNFPQLTIHKQNTNRINPSNFVIQNDNISYNGYEPYVNISSFIKENMSHLDFEFTFSIADIQSASNNSSNVTIPTVDVVPCFTLLSKDETRRTLGLSYVGNFDGVNNQAFVLYLDRQEILRLSYQFTTEKKYCIVKLTLDLENDLVKIIANNGLEEELKIAHVSVSDIVKDLVGMVLFFSDRSITYTTNKFYFMDMKITGDKIDFLGNVREDMKSLEDKVGDLTKAGTYSEDTVTNCLKELTTDELMRKIKIKALSKDVIDEDKLLEIITPMKDRQKINLTGEGNIFAKGVINKTRTPYVKSRESGKLFAPSLTARFLKNYNTLKTNPPGGIAFEFDMVYINNNNWDKYVDVNTDLYLGQSGLGRPPFESSAGNNWPITLRYNVDGVENLFQYTFEENNGIIREITYYTTEPYLSDPNKPYFNKYTVNRYLFSLEFLDENRSSLRFYINNIMVDYRIINGLGFSEGNNITSFSVGSLYSTDNNPYNSCTGSVVSELKVYTDNIWYNEDSNITRIDDIIYNKIPLEIDNTLKKAWYSGDSVDLENLVEEFDIYNHLDVNYTKGTKLFNIINIGDRGNSLNGVTCIKEDTKEVFCSSGTTLSIYNFTSYGDPYTAMSYTSGKREEFAIELDVIYTSDSVTDRYADLRTGLLVQPKNTYTLPTNQKFDIISFENEHILYGAGIMLSVDNGLSTLGTFTLRRGRDTTTGRCTAYRASGVNKLYINFFARSDDIYMVLYCNGSKVLEKNISSIGYERFNALTTMTFFPLVNNAGMLYKNVRMYRRAIPENLITSGKTYKSLKKFYMENRG